MQAFKVFLGKKAIDTIFYGDDQKVTREKVKKSLVDHDGYDPRITIVKER